MAIENGFFLQNNDDGSTTIFQCKHYSCYEDMVQDTNPPHYGICEDTRIRYTFDPVNGWEEAIKHCDTSSVTATSESMLEGVVAVDANGNEITGSIPTVIPTVANNIITVPVGYIDEEHTFEVNSSSGSGSIDFYKCVAVYGPQEVTRIKVENAGTSVVNGEYELTTLKTNYGGEVWKHMTAEYYMFKLSDNWGIGSDYNVSTEEAIYYNVGTEWELGYDYATETNTGTRPVPTVSEIQVTLNEPTWDGYKAVLNDGVYSFEETLTTGLTYGNGFTPTVGTVYNQDATILATLFIPYPGDSDITTYSYSELVTNGDASVDSDQLSKLFVPAGEKVRIKTRFASPDNDTISIYITTTGCQFSGIDTLEELEDNVRLLAEDGTVKYTSYLNMPGELAIKEDNVPNGNYYIEIDNTEGTAQVSMTGFYFHAYDDATGISDWVESGGSDTGDDSGDSDLPTSIDDFADRMYNGFELVSDEYGTQVFKETSQVLNGMIVYECLYKGGCYYCVMNDDRSAIIIAYYGTTSIKGNVSVGLLNNPDWQVYTADYPDGLKYPWDAFVSDYSPGTSGATTNTPLEMNPFSGAYSGGTQ